jgi:hypothetical protein
VQIKKYQLLVLSKLKANCSSLRENKFFVVNRDGEEYVIIKGAVPKSLKLQFKVICVQQELEMSAVLQTLIEQWIQADGPVDESFANLANEELEDVKGYVPKSLKLRFKTLCIMKRVKIRSVLYQLITEWVQVQ